MIQFKCSRMIHPGDMVMFNEQNQQHYVANAARPDEECIKDSLRVESLYVGLVEWDDSVTQPPLGIHFNGMTYVMLGNGGESLQYLANIKLLYALIKSGIRAMYSE